MAAGAGTHSCLSWLEQNTVTGCYAEQAVTSFQQSVLCIPDEALLLFCTI